MKRSITVAIALLATPAAAQTPASIIIQADQPGAKIDRNLFGQFAEHLGTGIYGGVWVGPQSPIPNVRGIRKDVVAALRAIKVPNVRWPGGCFADQYNWRDGIGPAAQRPVRANKNWGGVESNAFGTHEFMDFVEQIGAEAYISVNLGSGSPREAADWLEYLTTPEQTALGKERAANGHPAPYRLKFMGYGNETWGCGGDMTPESYVAEMNRYSVFVKNLNPAQSGTQRFMPAPDPMLRIAVGPDDANTAYTEAVMQAFPYPFYLGRKFDGLSLHHYTSGAEGLFRDPATGFGEKEWAQFMAAAYAMDAIIAKHSTIMDRYDPKKEVALVVDEWGNWLKPMDGTPMFNLHQAGPLRDALTTAITLNIFARHADRVRMANIAQMVNVLQAMILTDGSKMLLTPTYHIFKMYLPFQDATMLPVTVDAGRYVQGKIDMPRLDAIAARGKDGKVWLAISNLDPNAPVECNLAVSGLTASSAEGEVLTAERIDSVNSFDHPTTVQPRHLRVPVAAGRLRLSLPAKSVTVVALTR